MIIGFKNSRLCLNNFNSVKTPNKMRFLLLYCLHGHIKKKLASRFVKYSSISYCHKLQQT